LLLQSGEQISARRANGRAARSSPAMLQNHPGDSRGIIGKTYFGRGWYVNNRSSSVMASRRPFPNAGLRSLAGTRAARPSLIIWFLTTGHWRWHWGTGEALNNGTHEMDVCRWALGVGLATRVFSNGGRYQFQDDWETLTRRPFAWDSGGKTMS